MRKIYNCYDDPYLKNIVWHLRWLKKAFKEIDEKMEKERLKKIAKDNESNKNSEVENEEDDRIEAKKINIENTNEDDDRNLDDDKIKNNDDENEEESDSKLNEEEKSEKKSFLDAKNSDSDKFFLEPNHLKKVEETKEAVKYVNKNLNFNPKNGSLFDEKFTQDEKVKDEKSLVVVTESNEESVDTFKTVNSEPEKSIESNSTSKSFIENQEEKSNYESKTILKISKVKDVFGKVGKMKVRADNKNDDESHNDFGDKNGNDSESSHDTQSNDKTENLEIFQKENSSNDTPVKTGSCFYEKHLKDAEMKDEMISASVNDTILNKENGETFEIKNPERNKSSEKENIQNLFLKKENSIKKKETTNKLRDKAKTKYKVLKVKNALDKVGKIIKNEEKDEEEDSSEHEKPLEERKFSLQDFNCLMTHCHKSAFPSYILYAFEVLHEFTLFKIGFFKILLKYS